MERNIAALMREDTFTAHVRFRDGEKTYTYIAWMPLAVGDTVVVSAAGQHKVAEVVAVDDCVKIEPGSSISYSFVIDRVDREAHSACAARNEQIEELVRTAYQTNLRKSFAAQVLGGLDAETQARVLALTGSGPKAG